MADLDHRVLEGEDLTEYVEVAHGEGATLYRHPVLRGLCGEAWRIKLDDGRVILGAQVAYRRRRGGPSAYRYAKPPDGGRWTWTRPDLKTDEGCIHPT